MKHVYTLADLRNWGAVTREISPPIRLGVLGNPVRHSLSPQMQNAALRESGIDAQYARFQIRAEELREALRLVPQLNFLGLNLTIPHKIAALPSMDQLDATARCIGAINTVMIRDGMLVGFNTDAIGFSRAVQMEFERTLAGLKVLLLGAGGAARAIGMQCMLEKSQKLWIWNRSQERAREFSAKLHELESSTHVYAVERDDASFYPAIAAANLIVNATSADMHEDDTLLIPPERFTPDQLVYDTIYTPPRTKFLEAAAAAGARSANGLSMLLHQAAASFEIWFDRRAPINVMRAALDCLA